MKAIAIVAHDDDVVLWMGGTIHLLKDWEWHIISMCNNHNKERRIFFHKTANKLGGTANALDFLDYQNKEASSQSNRIPEMKQQLLSLIKNKHYDYVFTHSRDENGEYGPHANHREVCEVVQSLVSENNIVENFSKIAFFCYNPLYNLSGIPTVASQDAKFYMQLPYSSLAFKIDLIQLHKEEIVKNLQNELGSPCPNPEAFEGDNLRLPEPFLCRNL